MTQRYLLTSESVSPGHPDKIADQIADAVLDAALQKDRRARVACEVLVKTGLVLVAGEISTCAQLDVEGLVRSKLREIGYTYPELGFDAESCAVLLAIGQQSPDIRQGVDKGRDDELGAGDQGTLFGYAVQDTPEYMPAPLVYCHRLMARQAERFRSQALPWLRPDAKAQLTFLYEDHQVKSVQACVFSTQHSEEVDLDTLREAVLEEIIKPVLPEAWRTQHTQYHINPAGRFVNGGPRGDCGLTGRKLMVDTYGGASRHGGGAFSGKDPSKVDRSAAYMARFIAKHLVAVGAARKCEVQLSYAIGQSDPTAVSVESFGTSPLEDAELAAWVQNHFNLTPAGIIRSLNLLDITYSPTAVYGHFGRAQFPWEQLGNLESIRSSMPSW